MTRLKLDWLQEGMVLRSAARDAEGHELIVPGTVLTASHLSLLRLHGIEAVDIQPCSPPPALRPQDLPQDIGPEPATVLAQRFRHLDPDHPLVHALMIHALRRLKESGW